MTNALQTHLAPLSLPVLGDLLPTLIGTDGNDVLDGTIGNDVIAAKDGFDTIFGSLGQDSVDGGASYDYLSFSQYHGGLDFIGGPRTFTVGADFVRDNTGAIDTGFVNIEAIELSFIDLGSNLLSTPYVFDLSGFTGDPATGRTKVLLADVAARYTGSNLSDSLASNGGLIEADGGDGTDDFFYAYTAVATSTLIAHTDASGHEIVTVSDGSGADLQNFELLTFQGGAAGGAVLTADFSGLAMRIDWLASTSAGITGKTEVIGTLFDDSFQFGPGSDVFTGSGGYNIYRAYALWDATTQSGASFDGDIISDFGTSDVIDLTYTFYDQVHARFIGRDAFSGIAGEVRYVKQAGQTLLMSDGNGDGIADATLSFVNGAFDLEEETPGILVRVREPEPAKAAVPSDFDGNGTSDLALQGAHGAISYWLADGTQLTPGGSDLAPSGARVMGSGDFDGNGTAEVLMASRNGIVSTPFGTIGQIASHQSFIAAGDIDGDGTSDIVLRNAIDGTYSAWLIDGTTISATGMIGDPGRNFAFKALADFDGDGCDDILFQEAGGAYAVWHLDGTSVIGGGTIGDPGPTWFLAGTGDFDGDGRHDILFHNADGHAAAWELNGTRIVGEGLIADRGTFVIVGTGDYDADGKSDILFRDAESTLAVWHLDSTIIRGGGELGKLVAGYNLAAQASHVDFASLVFANRDGTIATWQVSGTTIVAGATLGNPGVFWTALATGDVTGLGSTDVLFRGEDGRLAVWSSDGGQLFDTGGMIGKPGPEWTFRAFADFNGDGRDDILFQNDDGGYFVWELAGRQIVGGGDVSAASGFDFVASGDFDGDGRADILLQDQATGEYMTRLMSGTTILGEGMIGGAAGRSFAGLGDFNGDGTDDIAFRDETTGVLSSWTMDGFDIVGGGIFGDPGSGKALAGILDLNQYGKDDFVFRDIDGQHTAWMLADTEIIASGIIGPALADWGLV